MKLKDEISKRREVIAAEQRALYDGARAAGREFSDEEIKKWDSLDAEDRDLAGKEERAIKRDELDRKAEAKPIVEKRPGDAWALTNEQRMTDYVHRTTGIESEGLSVGRMVAAALRGDWRGAEAEQRVMGSGVNTTGGFFVPDPISASVIDLARNASVLTRAGVLTVPMTGNNMTMVRVLTDPTGAWRGEGAEITESDATFDAILITPSSLATLIRCDNELLDDVPSFAAQVDGQMAAALAIELDRVGLYGTGTSAEPHGLRGRDGVNEVSMGTNGATPADYDDFLDLINEVELANGSPTTLVWSPRSKNTMAKIVTGITSDLTKLLPPADFTALTRLASTQVSVTETQGSSGVASTAFLGGWSNMAFAIRQTIQIEASRVSGTAFAQNQTLIRAILRADVAVMRPAQFGRLIGILA